MSQCLLMQQPHVSAHCPNARQDISISLSVWELHNHCPALLPCSLQVHIPCLSYSVVALGANTFPQHQNGSQFPNLSTLHTHSML